MADDITRHVASEIEGRLRDKAERLGLSYGVYLQGLVDGAEWSRGEVDDDPVIDRFVLDHGRATGSLVTLDEAMAPLRRFERRAA